MKVLLVHYRYFISGGPERYLFNVKAALEERGHQVIPFSIKNSQNVESEYSKYFVDNIGKSDEVFIHKYPKTLRTYWDLVAREFYSLKVRKKIEKLIDTEKPDVCYLLVYKRALSPSVIDACKKKGIPVINRISDYNTVCGAGSLYRAGQYCELCLKDDRHCAKEKCIKGNKIFSWMRFLSIRFHKWLHMQDKVNAYICTNGFMADMMEKYGYQKEKIHVIPTFFREKEEFVSVNKSNRIDPSQIKFLYIGNIDETKGIFDLLEAIEKLASIKQNFQLYIVGGLHEEENNKVRAFVREHDLEKFITLVPFIKGDEVFKYYLDTNVTVLPARWVENLPNTLIESIYFNRPVIVPDYGSFQYTTDENVSFRYKKLSSHSLYECLLEICNNPLSVEQKSLNCTQFFAENFAEDIHMDKLLTLLGEDGNENI